jgi:hypothetical protein
LNLVVFAFCGGKSLLFGRTYPYLSYCIHKVMKSSENFHSS